MKDKNIINDECYIVVNKISSIYNSSLNEEVFIYSADSICVENGIIHFNTDNVYSNIENKAQYDFDANKRIYWAHDRSIEISHNKNPLVITIKYREKEYELFKQNFHFKCDGYILNNFSSSSDEESYFCFEKKYNVHDIKQLYEDIWESGMAGYVMESDILKKCQKAILLNDLEICSKLFRDLLYFIAIESLKKRDYLFNNIELKNYMPQITEIRNESPVIYEPNENTSYIIIENGYDISRSERTLTIKCHVSTGEERTEADHYNGGLWRITPYEDKKYIITFPTQYLCDKYYGEYGKYYSIAIHKSFRNYIKHIYHDYHQYGGDPYESESYYDIGYTFYCGKVTEVIIEGEELR